MEKDRATDESAKPKDLRVQAYEKMIREEEQKRKDAYSLWTFAHQAEKAAFKNLVKEILRASPEEREELPHQSYADAVALMVQRWDVYTLRDRVVSSLMDELYRYEQELEKGIITMEETKDRATEYWNTEIRRAATDTAKAYAEYEQANKEEKQALDRKNDAEVNQVAEETREEAREMHKRKCIIKSQKWESFLMASKWECITRDAAASYKKRKASNEAYK